MNKIFHKAITVLSSVALIGTTITAAAAASYPSPFTTNAAVVYGASAASSDYTAAMNIVTNLNSENAGSVTLTGGEGVTEEEVPLGDGIVSGKITATLTDSKVPSLVDDTVAWDDGGGSDDYNIHEEIAITSASVELLTTLDDNDFEENVALTNDKGIEYKYVFDDALDVTKVGTADADDLYLTILGKSYEVTNMTATSFTVVTSTDYSLALGESAVVGGKTFVVEDLSSTAAKVNGETITAGSSKKIDGLRVKVKTNSIFYNENFPEKASVILQIGEDISKTYSNGEEYVGEDEDDPEWVWDLTNGLGDASDYIGVKYNFGQTEYDDDVVYAGGAYVFPENFAEVKFDGLTDLSYEDFKISFDDSEDLWNSTSLSSTEQTSNAPVLVIEAVNGDKDAIKITGQGSFINVETNKIYLRWASNTTPTEGTISANGGLELFYSDVSGEVSDAVKPRFGALNNATGAAAMTTKDLGDLIVGDTTVAINATVTSGNLVLTFTDGGAAKNITVDVGGVALSATAGELKWLGGDTETTSKETAEAGDVAVQGTNVGTYDHDVMNYNGLIVKEPETNADDDVVLISVPTDRVYGEVSVLAGGTASDDDGEAGALIVKDTESDKMSGKNLVVVGGSAINSVAADLLGGAYSEAAFTAKTGIGAGQFLIESFTKADGKTALLVAGYHAADTEKAVTYLLNNDVDTTPGKIIKKTASTFADLA